MLKNLLKKIIVSLCAVSVVLPFGGAVFNNAVTVTESTEYTIQNSGIMRVKANNVWTEGQVWVKVDGNWKEADVVKVKVNGVWEDSE